MQITVIRSTFSAASGLTLLQSRDSNQHRYTLHTLLLSACAAFVLFTATVPATAADAANKITAITPTASRSEVHVHVTSSKRFPARAMRPLLHIGEKTFRKSIAAPGGGVNELVFILPADEYAKLNAGDAVSVSYEGDRLNQKNWKFGALQK